MTLPQSLGIPEFSPLIYLLGRPGSEYTQNTQGAGLHSSPLTFAQDSFQTKPHRGSVTASPALALPEDLGVPEQTLPSVGLC